MIHSLDDLIRAFGRKHGALEGTILIYRLRRFPSARHGLPFAKRRAGKHRRDERLFVRKQKRPLNG